MSFLKLFIGVLLYIGLNCSYSYLSNSQQDVLALIKTVLYATAFQIGFILFIWCIIWLVRGSEKAPNLNKFILYIIYIIAILGIIYELLLPAESEKLSFKLSFINACTDSLNSSLTPITASKRLDVCSCVFSTIEDELSEDEMKKLISGKIPDEFKSISDKAANICKKEI